jgi:murein DD-endopeptidase MepM/ murein hydrolase activator NlpD
MRPSTSRVAHAITRVGLALAVVLVGAAAPAAGAHDAGRVGVVREPRATPRTRWVAPLTGPLVVRRRFEAPRTTWGAGHRGVDLAAPAGAVVRSAGAGRVTFAEVLAGRGVVVVRHGALRTTYEPVVPLLPVGAVVEAGTPVARLGPGHAGARAPDAVLHWGLLRGSAYLDPLLLLGRGPSRLVPVRPADAASTLAFGADAVSGARSDPATPPTRAARVADRERLVRTAPVAFGAPARGASLVLALLVAAAWAARRKRRRAPP